MNPRFTPINQSQEQSPKNPNQQRFTPVKQEDFSNTGYAGELKAFEKERSFTDFDKTIDELPFWGGETTYKLGGKEFSVSGMFSDGEKEKLKEFKRNPNISDDQFELAKATMGSGAAYYFDDNGLPRGLMPGQKPPKGKEIASIWGTQSEAEDDGLVTTAAKNIFSAIPGIIDNIADLAHLPYGLVTGKEADWYKEVKQTTESLRFKTSSESQKSILDTEGIDEMSDIFDSKRWNVSADNVVGTASSLVGTVIEFLAGGELAKSVGIGGKALAKIASSEAVGIGTKLASKIPYFVGGSMTNLGEALDAADEAGVKGKDKYTIAALVTLPVSAIEMVGGLEAKIMNNAIKQKEKSAMIKTLVKEFVKDNEGNLTKKGLKELYDASKVASTSVFTKMGKEFIETGAGEAGEEVLQNITQKASQQIYDNLFAEGKEVGKGRYGTKITSPESVAEYINDAIGGLIGGAGGNLMNARSDFRKAKAELQSEQAFSTIKKGKDAIKDLKAEIQSYQKAGQITPEQTEMAFHKIDKYNEYFEAIKGHDLTDEEKKRVSDLNWTGENLKVQMEALKNNPKAKDETSIQYKQLAVLQKIYKAADKEIEETLTKPLADEQLAVPVSIQRDIENKTETTPPKKSGFKMKSVAKAEDANEETPAAPKVNAEVNIKEVKKAQKLKDIDTTESQLKSEVDYLSSEMESLTRVSREYKNKTSFEDIDLTDDSEFVKSERLKDKDFNNRLKINDDIQSSEQAEQKSATEGQVEAINNLIETGMLEKEHAEPDSIAYASASITQGVRRIQYALSNTTDKKEKEQLKALSSAITKIQKFANEKAIKTERLKRYSELRPKDSDTKEVSKGKLNSVRKEIDALSKKIFGLELEKKSSKNKLKAGKIDIKIKNIKAEIRDLADLENTYKEYFDVKEEVAEKTPTATKVNAKVNTDVEAVIEKRRQKELNYDAKLAALKKQSTSNIEVEEGSVGVGGDLVVTNESKQALRDIITLATGDEFNSNEGFVRNGDWNGEGDFGFDSNGNVVLTRYADSKEGLTKSGKITSSETLTKLMNSYGGEQIPTSALVGGMVAYQTGGGNVTGTYRIPLEEFKKLIKKGYIQFAGFGNKEFVLSPHIAKQYLTEIDGKAVEQSLKETTKEETTPTTSNQSEIEAKKAVIEKRRQKELNKIVTNIFPNTKVKDIFYHWSVGPQISDEFGNDLNRVKGVWLSKLKDHWKDIVSNKSKRLGINEIKQHIVIINSEKVWVDATLSSPNKEQFPNGYDTIVAYNEADNSYSGDVKSDFKTIDDFEIVIKSKDQIHVLTKEELNKIDKINAKYDAKLAALKKPKKQKKAKKEPKEDIQIELSDEVKDTPIFEGTFKEALSEFEKEKEVEGTVIARDKNANGALSVEVNGKSYKIASSGDANKTGGSFGAKAKQEVGKKVKLRIVKKADWNADGKIINKTTGLPYGDKIEILNSKGEVIGKVQESYEKTKEQPIQEAVKPMDKKAQKDEIEKWKKEELKKAKILPKLDLSAEQFPKKYPAEKAENDRLIAEWKKLPAKIEAEYNAKLEALKEPEKEIKVEVKNNYEDMADKDIAEMPEFKEFKEKEAKEYNEKDAIEYFKKCKSRK